MFHWRSTAAVVCTDTALRGCFECCLKQLISGTEGGIDGDQWDRGERGDQGRRGACHVMACSGEGDTRDSLSIAYIDLAKKGCLLVN